MTDDNTSHYWVPRTRIRKGEPETTMHCERCGIAYEGGKHNEETCPKAV